METDNNGWEEYKKLILYRMDEQTKLSTDILKTLSKLTEDVAALKVKAAIAGGIAGIIATAVTSVGMEMVHIWK